MKTPDHRIVEFPKSRLATFDIGAMAKRKHAVSAYLEFDVTVARERVRSAKEHGARITFTAWLLKTIGDAIGRHKEVAAFRLGRRRLMVFDDAHISIIVEREIGGRKVPLPLVLRGVNRKTIEEIAAEIKAGEVRRRLMRPHIGGRPGRAGRLLYRLSFRSYRCPQCGHLSLWTVSSRPQAGQV